MNTFFEAKTGIWMEDSLRFFCCSLGGEFLRFISRFILRSFCFERKIQSEDFGGICQVVNAQAYALHCGRIDVCFRFASPLNRLMTGVSGTAWLVVGARMILYMKAFIQQFYLNHIHHIDNCVLANYCFLGITYCIFGSVKPNSVQLKQRIKVIHVHRGIIIWYGLTPGSADRSVYSQLSAVSQALLEACTKSQIVHTKFHAESR